MFKVNINKNHTLEVLHQLVETNFHQNANYFPDSFNKKQQEALELFKKRIFLEETIEETITFNKKLNFPNENKNLYLTTTAEELIDVFKLRSEVYTQINYQSQFPDTIEGLNFDILDTNSAIIFYKSNKIITGSMKVIFDSENKLPSEKYFPFDTLREEYDNIAELSRFIVLNDNKGLGLEFKNLFQGAYHIFMNNKVDIYLSCIKVEHKKLYDKFGGTNVVNATDNFGTLGLPINIMSWDPTQASRFFKKAFLNQK